jgi:hypothetical protein
MLGQYEAEQHHLLALVEAAQRAGRSEREIVSIVERYFGEPAATQLDIGREPGFVRRFLRRRSA